MSAIQKGSLVLVTGANGFIASHVVDQLLQAGFKVRGTVRDASKADWLKDYVADKYDASRLDIAVVPDMATEGAFDDAVKGVSAFIHVATDMSLSEDPNKVIPATVNGVNSALAAAASQPTMKHFVFASSAAAVTLPKPDVPFTITATTYNDDSVRIAWDTAVTSAENPYKALHVYAASKVAAEQAVWKFAEEEKPGFIVNSVIPNMNWGPLLSPGRQRPSSGGIIPGVYEKGLQASGMFKDYPPHYHIDVRDTARLHVAPLIDPDIRNERLFAYNESYDWEKVLKILHELRPDWKNEEIFEEKRKDLSVVERRGRTEEILRKDFERPGLTSMKESIKANIAHLK